jgi:flagellar biogenesis protein FliO
MIRIAILFALISTVVFSYPIASVKLGGGKSGEIFFKTVPDSNAPQVKIEGNTIELTFTGAELSSELKENSEIASNHPLIHRVVLISPENRVVKARIVINGSLENLKNRFQITKESDGYKAVLSYPAGEASSTAAFLEEEQLPLNFGKKSGEATSTKSSGLTVVFLCTAILLLGAGVFFLIKIAKKKVSAGSRKYLVEQLSYCGLGPKAGVSLVKVGNEFVLVGITAQQVTLLSTLPKLQEQYDSESAYERGAFRSVVEDELGKLRANT